MPDTDNKRAITDHRDIRLLGFSGFEASERFLGSLYNEIWVSNWKWEPSKEKASAYQPEEIKTEEDMRYHPALRSHVTIISAHGCVDTDTKQVIGFCGEGRNKPVLYTSSITNGAIGATSLLLIDACHIPELGPDLKAKLPSGSECLVVGLDGPSFDGTENYQSTVGRDSVTIIGAVIRELCYDYAPPFTAGMVDKVIDVVNAHSALSGRRKLAVY
jgi:hypothetical protein